MATIYERQAPSHRLSAKTIEVLLQALDQNVQRTSNGTDQDADNRYFNEDLNSFRNLSCDIMKQLFLHMEHNSKLIQRLLSEQEPRNRHVDVKNKSTTEGNTSNQSATVHEICRDASENAPPNDMSSRNGTTPEAAETSQSNGLRGYREASINLDQSNRSQPDRPTELTANVPMQLDPDRSNQSTRPNEAEKHQGQSNHRRNAATENSRSNDAGGSGTSRANGQSDQSDDLTSETHDDSDFSVTDDDADDDDECDDDDDDDDELSEEARPSHEKLGPRSRYWRHQLGFDSTFVRRSDSEHPDDHRGKKVFGVGGLFENTGGLSIKIYFDNEKLRPYTFECFDIWELDGGVSAAREYFSILKESTQENIRQIYDKFICHPRKLKFIKIVLDKSADKNYTPTTRQLKFGSGRSRVTDSMYRRQTSKNPARYKQQTVARVDGLRLSQLGVTLGVYFNKRDKDGLRFEYFDIWKLNNGPAATKEYLLQMKNSQSPTEKARFENLLRHESKTKEFVRAILDHG